MLIGMASKNAILIVEFANQNRDLGMSIKKASIYASEQRFRAIVMTAISTLVGFMPLLIASGAGSISRWSLGTGVFGGMLVATVLSLIFVPVLYVVIKDLERSFLKGDRTKRQKEDRENRQERNGNGNGNGSSNNGNGRSDRENVEQQSNISN